MAELLTHVLVPFVLLTVLSWWVDIDRRWIPVAMGGAAIPDLGKVYILVPPTRIEALLGIPFAYGPISSLAGVAVVGGAIALLFDDGTRRRAYGWLVFGGVTSLVLDGMRLYADGRAGYWLYPLAWRPPTPGLYVSSDPTVTVVAVGIAALVLGTDRLVVRN